jgi:hypothetical protein
MTLDQQTPQEVPELNKFEAHQYGKIPLKEGDSQEKATTTSTLPAPNLASPHLASTENAVSEGDIGLNENSNASTWPCWNIGTYKQGLAKIQNNLINGKSYNFSFTLKTDTRSDVQTKASIVKCYLLQDNWTSDKNYLHGLNSNIILNSWESNGEPTISEVIDPHLLAERTVSLKYNKDNQLYDTAIRGPFQAEFWQAMRVKLKTLTKDFDCWSLVPQTPGINVLPSTWAFKIKRYPDGTVTKFKACFCTRGDCQKEGVNYFETWAPMVHWHTIRIVMVLAAKLGLLSVQCNVTAAFIHRRLHEHEEINVHQPRGFYKGGTIQVLKLKRTLYGLKQLPKYHFKYFTDCLIRQGLTPSNFNPCLFLSSLLIVIIYVDNILIYEKNKNEINSFIK